MRPTIRLLPVALVLSCACGCGDPPRVIQGNVVSYEPSTKVVVVADEEPPHAQMTMHVEGADIGADPLVKDLVRISYRDRGGKLTALRVMNLTRQADFKKSSGGH
ncbi:MAG: hypothetical protein HY898_13810 [Deltaproteobacteria bacterium]|nr:hypothetical protein [Deltaproteobacteria bacterium]